MTGFSQNRYGFVTRTPIPNSSLNPGGTVDCRCTAREMRRPASLRPKKMHEGDDPLRARGMKGTFRDRNQKKVGRAEPGIQGSHSTFPMCSLRDWCGSGQCGMGWGAGDVRMRGCGDVRMWGGGAHPILSATCPLVRERQLRHCAWIIISTRRGCGRLRDEILRVELLPRTALFSATFHGSSNRSRLLVRHG